MPSETITIDEVPMDTPSISNAPPARRETATAADTRPPTSGIRRAEASATTASEDRAAISARSQAAASRTRDDDDGAGGRVPTRFVPAQRPAVPDGSAAATLAREVGQQILAHPALAKRAQANADGATVLAMLQ
jgi:hypothetical protein